MTALKYYQHYQRNGRALLRGTTALFFDDTFERRWQKPHRYKAPDQWLVRYRERLLLCQDTMLPVVRIVNDSEPVNRVKEGPHD